MSKDAKREARELAAAGEAAIRVMDEMEARRPHRAGMFGGDRAEIQAQVDRLRAFGGEDYRAPAETYSPPAPEVPKEEPKCGYCGAPNNSCGGSCWAC